jgi:hypothetical protein
MADDILITSSTELMSNFKQAEIMAPEEKFEALQTTSGTALLFSIGTDGVLYLTAEAPGGQTGWTRTDLSSAAAAGAAGSKAGTFAVAQNRATQAIDLALVLTASAGDTLLLALGKSGADPSWAAQPTWQAVPFDDAAHPMSKIVIQNVFISEASDGEYIVVDVLRDPSSAAPVIFRYYIDPTRKITGQAWNPHDIAGDIDAATVTSCLGRRTGDRIDGLYTGGSIAGHGQLMFQPLFNAFKPRIPANPARLSLPEGAVPSALAAVAMQGNATDLYVAFGQVVYLFAAGNQRDGATGVKVIDDPLFLDVQRLFGAATATEVVLWGLNRANQIFYVK